MIKIDEYGKREICKIEKFNNIIYPNRSKNWIKYRFYDNPYSQSSYNHSLIAEDENGNIIGELLQMPTKFFYQKEEYYGFWGMDLFVVDKERTGTAGVDLSLALSKNTFSYSHTDLALKIRLKLKDKLVGHINRYVYYNYSNILSILFGYFKPKNKIKSDFPSNVNYKKYFFKQIEKKDLPNDIHTWLNGGLEFTREKKFIEWRFFNNNQYAFYELKDCKEYTYFVLRTLVWKGINAMILVDYRCNFNDTKIINAILKSTKIISKKLNRKIILTGCSLAEFEQILKLNKYKLVAKEPILAKSNMNFAKNIPILVTYADSDSDFNYGSNKEDSIFILTINKFINKIKRLWN